jgi:hypothetical protein
MSGAGVIEVYLAELATRLPTPIVAELGDGLCDSYDAHRARGLTTEQAERVAVAEFGDPATVIAAFVASNPARGAARSLLVTGPVVGATWAAVLLARHAWDWPVGLGTRIWFGLAVLTAVALLALAAFQTRYRPAARSAVAACLVLLAVDMSMLGYVATTGQLASWPVPVAAALSALRIGFTLTKLPRVLPLAYSSDGGARRGRAPSSLNGSTAARHAGRACSIPWTKEVVRVVADVVITMGCGVACPVIPGKGYEEWVLDDPAGKDVAAVGPVRDEIERRVLNLLEQLEVSAQRQPQLPAG